MTSQPEGGVVSDASPDSPGSTVAETPTRPRPRPQVGWGQLRRRQQPEGLFVRAVDGAKNDTPPVYLSGLGGTTTYWTAAEGESHLPAGSTLVDLYGFGRSPRPLTRYTLEKHLAALEPVLSSRAPSIVVGHSFGAALAVAYAARHPEQVSGLVLISLPAYGGPEGARRWFRQKLRGWFLTNMVLTALACMTTRRLLGPLLPVILRDIPREVARDLVEHNFMSSTTSLWNVLYRHDPGEDLQSLPAHIPVLFIHGTEDATAPIESVRRLSANRPGSRLVVLTGVDHHPWLRSPGECAGAIARWAASAEGLPWDNAEQVRYERQG